MQLLLRVKNKVDILFRNRDKVNPNDETLDVKCLKRGDIVVVVPDNHNWGKQELINPDWRIIKAPNLSEADTADFTDPEDDFDTDPMCQRRKWMIDLDNVNLTQEFIDYLNDDTRQQPSYTSVWTREQLLSLKIIRPTRKGE